MNKKVLFVCVENACRSQMAEAFARMRGWSASDVFSAGSSPSGRVNPKAVDAMRELGYDMSGHRTKSLAEIPAKKFDVVVTMGCGDACPNVAAERRLDWKVPDPASMTPAEFRKVRDSIGRKVCAMLESLSAPGGDRSPARRRRSSPATFTRDHVPNGQVAVRN